MNYFREVVIKAFTWKCPPNNLTGGAGNEGSRVIRI
jgi:hypothetical protein